MNILHGFQTMEHSRTRNRAPTLVVVSRNPLQFWIQNLVERNLNVWRTRNLRITAGNHIPYFEALKKMQGLFKSTENHILAIGCCIFNYMLRCLDFKNILIWPGFSHFFSRDFFLNDMCAFWKCMCALRGMESSLCTCSLKSRRCTWMPRGMVIEVRFPRKCCRLF